MVYDLDDFMILNIKGVHYRCFVFNMSKNTAIKLTNDYRLDDRGTLWIWILVQNDEYGFILFHLKLEKIYCAGVMN